MKNRFLLAAAAALLIASHTADAITVSLNPVSLNVGQGSSFALDIVISGLKSNSAPSLGAFDLDLNFDPTHFSCTGAVFGTGLDLFGFGSDSDMTDHGNGIVNLYELSYDSATDLNALQPDTFILATVSFTALAVGDAAFNLSLNYLVDANGDPLTADHSGARVTVASASVPLPGTLWLFLPGVIGLFSARRRYDTQGERQDTLVYRDRGL